MSKTSAMETERRAEAEVARAYQALRAAKGTAGEAEARRCYEVEQGLTRRAWRRVR